MMQIVSQIRKNQKSSLVFLWILLWFVPWGSRLYFETNIYLAFFSGFFCLSLALILFITPGALLYISLSEKTEPFFYLGIIPVGFSFSVMMIGLIGLMGRYLEFSFDTVKSLFFLIGLILLIFLQMKSDQINTSKLTQYLRHFLSNRILLFSLFLSISLAFNGLLFFIDDATYLAYLTNWQYSDRLGFQNLIHSPAVLELERFWLAMYPMGQAILSDLSGIPGILLFSNYLELLLVPLAVLTSYWFARYLGLSRRTASISVLIQISFFAWMIGEIRPVGTWFYNSMAEDKVSAVFHLAPVFLIFVIKYFESASWKKNILVFLAGVSLTLTHPVSLFFTCIIALWFGILRLVLRKNTLKQVSIIVILIVLLIAPYLAIRIINHSSQAGFVSGLANKGGASYELEKYIYYLNDTFYGLNPNLLLFIDMEIDGMYLLFRLIPLFIGVLALILSFTYLRNGLVYLYVFCATLLIFFVTLPYTGWIFGYFTDARLISRAPWFFPLGLGFVITFQAFSKTLKTLSLRTQFIDKLFNYLNNDLLIIFSFFIFTLPVLFFMNLSQISAYFKILDRNTQLAEIGSIIDLNSESQVVSIALNENDLLILPGISAHTRLISFREEKLDNGHNHYLTEDEIKARIYASTVIRSLNTDEKTSQERCSFIDEYEVEFVIADNKDADLYLELISKCGIVAEKIYQTKDKALLQIQVSGQE